METHGAQRRRDRRRYTGHGGVLVNEQEDWVDLAGFHFDPLDLEELEQWLHDLPVIDGVDDAIRESLDIINAASAYWLDEWGAYATEASQVCSALHKRFDAIYQRLEFEDAGTIASVVRWALWEHEGSDSRLTATYALALAIESLQQICSWQIDLRRESLALALGTEVDLASLEHARRELYLEEIGARLAHADYLASARHALLVARLCEQAEHLSAKAAGYHVAELMRSAIEAAASSVRGSAGGRGNSRADSAKQQAVTQMREQIRRAAVSILSARPSATRRELTSALVARGVASAPTIRKYLDALDLPPGKN